MGFHIEQPKDSVELRFGRKTSSRIIRGFALDWVRREVYQQRVRLVKVSSSKSLQQAKSHIYFSSPSSSCCPHPLSRPLEAPGGGSLPAPLSAGRLQGGDVRTVVGSHLEKHSIPIFLVIQCLSGTTTVSTTFYM